MSRYSDRRAPVGLVLQGGGARGAYQVGALKAIAEIAGGRRNPFPIIAGASVGAINAAPLAASSINFPQGVAQLETLWRGLTCDAVYDTRLRTIIATSARWLWAIGLGGIVFGDPRALLDNAPLRALLSREFNRDGISYAIRRGALRALCVTASSYHDGEAVTFFESDDKIVGWRRARRRGLRAEIRTDHLMASSALPFVFPAVKLNGHYFGDGALRLKAPLSPAIRMGAEKILVIGVRDNMPEAETPEGQEPYPTIGALSGHALDIMFNDDLDSDIERLTRINETIRLMRPEARAEIGLREIDIMTLQPSRDLRDIAAKNAREMPGPIRILLRGVGSWGKDYRLVSYLLFEPGYIGDLIDLGYADAMARRGEIRAFLLPGG